MSESSYLIHNPGYSKICHPIIRSAKGAYFTAINGERYFDAGLGAGSQILGHANSKVIKTVERQIKDGSIYLCNHSQIHEFCDRLIEVLPSDHFHYVFCNSGSEATQRALRIARAATGKERIGYFQGGWHGMNEWTLCEDAGHFGNNFLKTEDGIPKSVKHHSLSLPYNDDKAFNLISKNANSLACIIIEPVQGSNPRNDILPFLKDLEDCCKQNNILLVVDEIITGFRLGIGGASKSWGLNPDIITYGKIVGGGLPIGLVASTENVAIKSFKNPEKKILTGGTFSANPLVSATGLAVIKELQRLDYSELDDLGNFMRAKLNNVFAIENLPFSAIGVGSISRLAFTNKSFRNRLERDKLEASYEVKNKFRLKILDQNVLWPTNGILFTGFCHSRKQISNLCDKIFIVARQLVTNNEL